MRDRSNNIRFLSVLADSGPLPVSTISARSGLTMRQCSSTASRLVANGKLSRIKPKLSEGGGYYRYFLSPDQLEAYYRLASGARAVVMVGLDAITVQDRLRFLRSMEGRTVYGESPILSAIIEDYERTLRVVRVREDDLVA